jgi:hypothetical protein
MPAGFLSGLIGGFGQSMAQSQQQNHQRDMWEKQMRSEALQHIADTHPEEADWAIGQIEDIWNPQKGKNPQPGVLTQFARKMLGIKPRPAGQVGPAQATTQAPAQASAAPPPQTPTPEPQPDAIRT